MVKGLYDLFFQHFNIVALNFIFYQSRGFSYKTFIPSLPLKKELSKVANLTNHIFQFIAPTQFENFGLSKYSMIQHNWF